MAEQERAFAIQAEPDLIWRLLRAEVKAGVDDGRARILREEVPRYLDLDVRLGWGLRVRYTYRISVQGTHTEIEARVVPYGIRFALANIVSLGRGATPHLLAVTQGLANLKAEAERRT